MRVPVCACVCVCGTIAETFRDLVDLRRPFSPSPRPHNPTILPGIVAERATRSETLCQVAAGGQRSRARTIRASSLSLEGNKAPSELRGEGFGVDDVRSRNFFTSEGHIKIETDFNVYLIIYICCFHTPLEPKGALLEA